MQQYWLGLRGRLQRPIKRTLGNEAHAAFKDRLKKLFLLKY